MTKEELQRYQDLKKMFEKPEREEYDMVRNDPIASLDPEGLKHCLKTFELQTQIIQQIPLEMFNDREIALLALSQPQMNDDVGEEIMKIHGSDKELVKDILQNTSHGWFYYEIEASLKNDKETAYHAILQFPQNISCIGSELRTELSGNNDEYKAAYEKHFFLNTNEWQVLQAGVLETLGSDLGLTLHKQKQEFEGLTPAFDRERRKKIDFLHALSDGVIYAESFSKSDLSKFNPPLLVKHNEILDIFEYGMLKNESSRLLEIQERLEHNQEFPDHQLPVPVYSPLELSIADVVKHYGMNEDTIDMKSLSPDLRKSVNSVLMHEKFMNEISMTIKQQQEQSHMQTKRMKI